MAINDTWFAAWSEYDAARMDADAKRRSWKYRADRPKKYSTEERQAAWNVYQEACKREKVAKQAYDAVKDQ